MVRCCRFLFLSTTEIINTHTTWRSRPDDDVFYLFLQKQPNCDTDRHSECRSSSFGPQSSSFGLCTSATLALHLCQKAAEFLSCTKPPDFVASRRSFTGFAPAPRLRHAMQPLFELPRRTPLGCPRTQGHMHSQGRIIWTASRHLFRRSTSFQRPIHKRS